MPGRSEKMLSTFRFELLINGRKLAKVTEVTGIGYTVETIKFATIFTKLKHGHKFSRFGSRNTSLVTIRRGVLDDDAPGFLHWMNRLGYIPSHSGGFPSWVGDWYNYIPNPYERVTVSIVPILRGREKYGERKVSKARTLNLHNAFPVMFRGGEYSSLASGILMEELQLEYESISYGELG